MQARVEKLYKGTVVISAQIEVYSAKDLIKFVTSMGLTISEKRAEKDMLYLEATYRGELADTEDMH